MARHGAPLVVVIDDEEDVVTFLRLALEDNGYEVESTSKPGEAVGILEARQPDALLLDLVMPERTGISVYMDILERPALSDLKVLFLSALSLGEDFQELLQSQGPLPQPAGFVEKPIELEKLLETLKHVLATDRDPAKGIGEVS